MFAVAPRHKVDKISVPTPFAHPGERILSCTCMLVCLLATLTLLLPVGPSDLLMCCAVCRRGGGRSRAETSAPLFLSSSPKGCWEEPSKSVRGTLSPDGAAAAAALLLRRSPVLQ